MTGTVRDLLTWAARQVKTMETGDNIQPYAALAGHANGQPWCATFVVAGWKVSHVLVVAGTDTPYTPTMQKDFKSAGRLFDEPQPGDAGFVFYPNLGRIGHVFLVERVQGDFVNTIEGNTNLDGSRTGVGVFRHSRRWHRGGSLRGFGRPHFGAPAANTRPVVSLANIKLAATKNAPAPEGVPGVRPRDTRVVEAALVAEGLLSSHFAGDGSFGTVTVAAYRQWQRRLGLSGDNADGIPGEDSLRKLGARRGFQVVA
jgi:CHAP domain